MSSGSVTNPFKSHQDEFFKAVDQGDLSDTLKEYPLDQAENYASLHEFILGNNRVDDDRLSKLVDIIKKNYPDNQELIQKVNKMAQEQLTRIFHHKAGAIGLGPAIKEETKRYGLDFVLENVSIAYSFLQFFNEIDGKKLPFEYRLKCAETFSKNNPELFILKFFDVFTEKEVRTRKTDSPLDRLINQCCADPKCSDETKRQFEERVRAVDSSENDVKSFLEPFGPGMAKMTVETAELSQITFDAKEVAKLTFEQKLELGEQWRQTDPNFFAVYFLNLFSEGEIKNEAQFNRVVALAEEELANPKSTPENQSYLAKQKMYVERLRDPSRSDGKDGALWDCLGLAHSKGTSGASSSLESPKGLWTFKLQGKYDPHALGPWKTETIGIEDFMALQRDLFPAVEPDSSSFETDSYLFPVVEFPPGSVFDHLGFKYESGPSGVYLTIPDAETLNEGWRALRAQESYQHLPELTFVSCAGVATSEEFVELLRKYDVVISTGKENIHDAFSHVIPTILCAVTNEEFSFVDSYENTRNRMRWMLAYGLEVLRFVQNQHTSDERDMAFITLIGESLAVLSDTVTATGSGQERNEYMREWEEEYFFKTIESVNGLPLTYSFPYYLWNKGGLKEALTCLGMKDPASDPLPDLDVNPYDDSWGFGVFQPKSMVPDYKEKWQQFKQEYEQALDNEDERAKIQAQSPDGLVLTDREHPFEKSS